MAELKNFRWEIFNEWLESEERPELIKRMVKDYPPNKWYKIKSTGQVCLLRGWAEDGTVRVLILQSFNPDLIISADREVFGVDPKDLEECDEPANFQMN